MNNVAIQFNIKHTNGCLIYREDGHDVKVDFEDIDHAMRICRVLFLEKSINDEEYSYLLGMIDSKKPTYIVSKESLTYSPFHQFFATLP